MLVFMEKKSVHYTRVNTVYIYIYVQSFTQVKNYIMLLDPISSFSFGLSVDSNLDISNVMCPLEENFAVVADCMQFTIRRLK